MIKFHYEDIEQQPMIDDINHWLDITDLSCNDVPKKWEAAWSDIERSLAAGFSLEKLTPNYFKYDILRYNGKFVRAAENVEFEFYRSVKNHYFSKYLNSTHTIEFGAGTGHNLVSLSKINPNTSLTATDRAFSTRGVIEKINEECYMDIKWLHFDMMEPVDIDLNDTAVITMHSMEQLGLNFTKFVDFLIAKKPQICLHIEPIYEFYTDSEFDLLAKKYHLKKGYLVGFWDYLKSKKVEIIEEKRLHFGSMYHEGYSVIVWKP